MTADRSSQNPQPGFSVKANEWRRGGLYDSLGHRPDGVGKVLQTAAVFFYAVHEALMVVVGDGFDPREGVEAARTEAAVLAVELTEEHGGDVEVRQGRGPHLGVDDVGGGVGVPGRDDVEVHRKVGLLDVFAKLFPWDGHEFDEHGRGRELCLLLDELHLAVPEVAVLEEGLGFGLLVGDGEKLLLECEKEVFYHDCDICLSFSSSFLTMRSSSSGCSPMNWRRGMVKPLPRPARSPSLWTRP